MRVLYVAAETYPLAKTGGLADVAAALPAALRQFDVETRILVPAYPGALSRVVSPQQIAALPNLLGYDARIIEGLLPGTGCPAWLLDCPDLYNRNGGPYAAEDGVAWPDNALRFAVLSAAAAAIAQGTLGHWRPDVVHANDRHCGLVPWFMARNPAPRPPCIFTVHNLAYQGLFDAGSFPRLGLPWDRYKDMEFYGRISFLKAGITGADVITTVSPHYAKEILSEEYGCGMEGVLREKSSRLVGILNGADYQIWDPRTDAHLPAQYSARDLRPKLSCKRALQTELRLRADDRTPLIVFLSRLVHQKMPDIMAAVAPRLVELGFQFAVLGEGDLGYEVAFEELARRYPGHVAVRIGYDDAFAHQMLAGADMLAHPSRFEPCGLVPIYALRYGTVPLVRRTGGLADTVTDATPAALQHGTATGFSFDEISEAALLECATRARALYDQELAWRKIQASGMKKDFSWRRSAWLHAQLYRGVAGRREGCANTRVA